MKKNILLVHSFIVLPLLTSSFIFSSEMSKRDKDFPVLTRSGSHSRKNRKERRKEQQDPQVTKIVIKETETPSGRQLDEVIVTTSDVSNEQVIEQAIETAPATEQVEMVTPAIQVAGDEQGTVIELPMPERKREKAEIPAPVETTTAKNPSIIPTKDVIKERMTKVFAAIQEISAKTTDNVSEEVQEADLLAASTYQPAPAVKQGLGWGDWVKSTVSSQWFALDAIKAKTFDPQNADHMRGLMNAVEKLVLNGDSKGLTDLLAACRTNYPKNLELKKKIALQVQARFKLDEDTAIDQYKKSIALENEKLVATQKAIFDQSAALVTILTQQLEKNANELKNAEMKYGFEISAITNTQNTKAQNARTGNDILYKLRRDIHNNNSVTPFDYKSIEYLPLKTNIAQITDTLHADITKSLKILNEANNTIKSALSLLSDSEKPAVLQLTDK
jgi:hypothetical protein